MPLKIDSSAAGTGLTRLYFKTLRIMTLAFVVEFFLLMQPAIGETFQGQLLFWILPLLAILALVSTVLSTSKSANMNYLSGFTVGSFIAFALHTKRSVGDPWAIQVVVVVGTFMSLLTLLAWYKLRSLSK
jgi:hypothetical protein